MEEIWKKSKFHDIVLNKSPTLDSNFKCLLVTQLGKYSRQLNIWM